MINPLISSLYHVTNISSYSIEKDSHLLHVSLHTFLPCLEFAINSKCMFCHLTFLCVKFFRYIFDSASTQDLYPHLKLAVECETVGQFALYVKITLH